MTLFLKVATFLAIADDGNFVVAAFFEDLAGDFRAGNHRGTDFDRIAVGGKENVFKIDLRTDALVALEGLNKNDVPVFDEVLLRASLNNREFGHNGRSLQQMLKSSKYVLRSLYAAYWKSFASVHSDGGASARILADSGFVESFYDRYVNVQFY